MTENLFIEQCIVCGHNFAKLFIPEHEQPLETLAWPKSFKEAKTCKNYLLKYVRCVNCGHIWNTNFDYREIPYKDSNNLMFNKGQKWQNETGKVADYILDFLKPGMRVVEIGCGNGEMIKCIAKKMPKCKFYCFDPNGGIKHDLQNIHFFQSLFLPDSSISKFKPDLIISRHVLEHLNSPSSFLQEIVFYASKTGYFPHVYFEVPCVDNAITENRISDFYYEHNSHFTRSSFSCFFQNNGCNIESIHSIYNNEVICGLATIKPQFKQLQYAQETDNYYNAVCLSIPEMKKCQINILKKQKPIAIWGGSGKAATFINFFDFNNNDFPLVVDSDVRKLGFYVPKTGQKIMSPDILLKEKDVIIIVPSKWRLPDIYQEIKCLGIQYSEILYENNGVLVHMED